MSKHAMPAAAEPRPRPRRDPAYTLRLLREALGLTQNEIASRSGIAQGEVSKIERRGDVLASTLRRYAEGLGGKLELRVVVGGRSYRIELDDERP